MLPKSKYDENFSNDIDKLESNNSNYSRMARSIDPPSDNNYREQEKNLICSSVLNSDNEVHIIVTNQNNNQNNPVTNKSTSIARNARSQSIIIVKPPYPPTIKPRDLVNDLFKIKSRTPKMLNEFFIYRKALVQELKKKKLRVKMTLVSSQASTYWHQETQQVKEAYRQLAREAERLYLQERRQSQQSSNPSTNLENPFNPSISSAPVTSALASHFKDIGPVLEINSSAIMFNNAPASITSVHSCISDNDISDYIQTFPARNIYGQNQNTLCPNANASNPSFNPVNFDFPIWRNYDQSLIVTQSGQYKYTSPNLSTESDVFTPIVPSQRYHPDPETENEYTTQESQK
ncbi:24305_t:CDS:2 [Cetraspora pellucida]|uniref:24305_t:CDS:1 n=1 Tax=Cetraspora pellucida TaxID=1433469 RepID=A0A9N9JP96_9GLOM|nr:24305_t:CDS:2 [Cetraspora pellucida]